MKKLLTLSALLLFGSNAWSLETGMICKWTNKCDANIYGDRKRCDRAAAEYAAERGDVWLLVSINEVSSTGTVYEFNKDKPEWQRDLEPKINEYEVKYTFDRDMLVLNTCEHLSWVTHSPICSSLNRATLELTRTFERTHRPNFYPTEYIVETSAKCELKTVEEIDALAEPFIKKYEEQLGKRKF